MFPEFTRAGAAGVVLAAMVAWLAPTAYADCVIDQQQGLTGPWIAIVGEGPTGHYEAGQTFQAGESGLLQTLNLHGGVSNASVGTGPLHIELRSTTGGMPDAGAPLLSHTVAFAELPPVFQSAEFAVDLSAHAVSLEAGTSYALTLGVTSGAFDWYLRGNDPYAAGEKLQREAPDGAWSAAPYYDAFFRTTVCRDAVSTEDPWAIASWGLVKSGYR